MELDVKAIKFAFDEDQKAFIENMQRS